MWPTISYQALDLALTQTLYEISIMSTESPDNGSEGGQKGLEKDQHPDITKTQNAISTLLNAEVRQFVKKGEIYHCCWQASLEPLKGFATFTITQPAHSMSCEELFVYIFAFM